MVDPAGGHGEDIVVDSDGNDVVFGGPAVPVSGEGAPAPEMTASDSGTTLDLRDVVDFVAGPAAEADGTLHLVGQVEVQATDVGTIAIIDTSANLFLDENGNLTVLG